MTMLRNTDVLSEIFERDNPDFDPGRDYCSWSPDTVAGVSLKRACYIHDQRYEQGAPKAQADRELRDNIRRLGRAAGKPRLFWAVSRLYYRGVCTLVSRVFYWKASHHTGEAKS